MTETERIKVILVDDHTLFRGGMKGLLSMRKECEVVGEASNGIEFLDLIGKVDFDVVLLDIDMPVMNGMEAARKALTEHPEMRIIALSMHGASEYYFAMVESGVKGFLLKNSDIDEVEQAIICVHEGGSFFSKELLDDFVEDLRESDKQLPEEENADTLSEREREVLLLICKGLSNVEIAEKLFISKRTVDKHRANILEKTGCKNTANMVVYAIKNSLVDL